ncbi:LytTR family transcriptional regulator [Chitinophaga pendula]|uniref:LytR/AlgR family response regulator transcription factor n=1 Tax=Chitinophaga TaxID=79328 RepID=UPI0012FD1B9A|nr:MULTISPECIES: LytTR family DNA-binding domain-containing protein [Chitinophaga]UCJ05948.1 LytTR family transcriptional regulator [Chitinophaga pendula]
MSLIILIVGQAAPGMQHWRHYFDHLEFVYVAGQYDTLQQAMPLLNSTMVHALVLGKNIPELANDTNPGEELNDQPINIITLTYPEKRKHVFEILNVDILKIPVTKLTITNILEKIYYKVMTEGVETPIKKKSYHDHFFVHYENKYHRVPINTLRYTEVIGNTCILHGENRTFTTDSIEQINAYLPPWQFTRVHKLFIVNLHFVDQITTGIVRVGAVAIPVKPGYSQELQRQYDIFRKLKEDSRNPLQN